MVRAKGVTLTEIGKGKGKIFGFKETMATPWGFEPNLRRQSSVIIIILWSHIIGGLSRLSDSPNHVNVSLIQLSAAPRTRPMAGFHAGGEGRI